MRSPYKAWDISSTYMFSDARVQDTHTMATPMTTVTTDAMTERENVLPSQKCSTRHTKGMMSSLAICEGDPHGDQPQNQSA